MKNLQIFPASDLQNVFGKNTYLKGRRYFLQNRVVSLETASETANTIVLNASVIGSGNQRYSQIVAINKTGHHFNINGKCSCPVGYNCKHVVAVCLTYYQPTPQPSPVTNKQYIDWLSSFNETAGQPNSTHHFVAYVLHQHSSNKTFSLSLFITHKTKRGHLTTGTRVSHSNIRYGYYSEKHFSTEDQELLRFLVGLESDFQDNTLITGSLGYLTLNKALQNNRLFWVSHQQTPPLSSGNPRALQLSWKTRNDNAYILNATLTNQEIILPTEPPLYLDKENLLLGPVEHPNLTYRQFRQVLSAPSIPFEHIEDFSLRLLTEHPELPLPPPKPVTLTELDGLHPHPRLQLLGQSLNDGSYIHLIRLRFDYGNHTISALPTKPVSSLKTQQGFIKIQRDLMHENTAVQILLKFGFQQFKAANNQDLFFYSPTDNNTTISSATRWAHFIDDKLPELLQQGWIADTDDTFLMQFQQPQNWQTDIEQSDNDWFEMHFNITINNQSLPLLPLITPVLENYQRDRLPEILSIPLEQHQYVNITAKQLKPFLDILYELFDSAYFDDSGNARISRYNAAATAELEKHSYGLFNIKGGQKLIETGKKIRNFKGIVNVSPPAALKTQLRPYQQKGLNWLQFLREYRFGGILADDMGLGKTVQTLAHLLLEKKSGRMDKPCLIVAPTSLMSNWRREVQRFTPNLSVLTLQGADRKQRFDFISQYDLVLTTYPLLPRDEQYLLTHTYYYLILDEAQVIKNPKSQAADTVRRINTQHRLCLTGTPMENHLGELWALYDFLMPGFLGDLTWFKKMYRTPIENYGNTEKQARLSKRLQPFMLRRTKNEVATELPEKTEIICSVQLHEKQAALYESIRVSMDKKVRDAIAEKGLARSHITILDALLKLRQTCCDPRTLNLQTAQKLKQSAKLDLLMEMLPELLEEGRRILLFSQFTRMLALIETELKAKAIDYTKLTGQTRKRDEAIEQFKNGAANVFLISLKAGGVGLNLTEADTVIIYDPWWNPAVENQAADRTHRIGQDKAVFVYKLVTENTVEEKILAMQEKKRALAENVYHGDQKEQTLQLTADDLTDLFKPLTN